jgi:large subunit ribosomal protein L2
MGGCFCILRGDRNRWLGRRPRVRGVVMNPVDHPMSGGEGRTSGGGHPISPWRQLAKGCPTRKRSKKSNRMILMRRNGREVKKGNVCRVPLKRFFLLIHI